MCMYVYLSLQFVCVCVCVNMCVCTHIVCMQRVCLCVCIQKYTQCVLAYIPIHTGERSEIHSRLCLIILTCVVEDQFANAFLHDPNISFPVTLQRAVRHSKVCLCPLSFHPLRSRCFIENFARSDNQKVHLWLAQCWVS